MEKQKKEKVSTNNPKNDSRRFESRPWPYALIVTGLIMSRLLMRGIIPLFSDIIEETVGMMFLLAAYIVLILVSRRLEKRNLVKGLSSLIVYMYMLFFCMHNLPKDDSNPVIVILQVVSITGHLFLGTIAAIELARSAVIQIVKIKKKEELAVETTETLVALLISIVAIIISALKR